MTLDEATIQLLLTVTKAVSQLELPGDIKADLNAALEQFEEAFMVEVIGHEVLD